MMQTPAFCPLSTTFLFAMIQSGTGLFLSDLKRGSLSRFWDDNINTLIIVLCQAETAFENPIRFFYLPYILYVFKIIELISDINEGTNGETSENVPASLTIEYSRFYREQRDFLEDKRFGIFREN